MNTLPERPTMGGPLAVNLRVDSICQEFERAWKGGQRPRIEDFVARIEPAIQSIALRELIAVEVELSEGAADISEHRRRFAQHLSAVQEGWDLAKRSLPPGALPLTAAYFDDESRRSERAPSPTAIVSGALPERIGRYAIRDVLGTGGFAIVYLAHDTQLNRMVALKVPRPDRFDSEEDLEEFLGEARNAAQLDHRAVVRIHDVQCEADTPYIVQQLVPGHNLRDLAATRRFSPPEIVDLVIRVAEAIGYAHEHGIVHRDLKPANIIIDEAGRPYVADFGLAVHASEQSLRRGELAGTFPYMSPEQIRGEVHRLDGRSDIWSLGVILYELLTGVRPFSATDQDQLFDEIERRDPRPPRQVNPAVPRELSRICLECLAKRATDRYESVADLIEDLQHWMDVPAEKPTARQDGKLTERADPQRPPKIIPKGLRSYDADDADFFLELLPGPRDRDGLPKSIRFWKNRIECMDPDESFSVGLIYGPSGCGKSSLMKAGLLPRLAPVILPVFIEATAEDTEVRVLKGLRKHVSRLPVDLDLPQALRLLRDHPAYQERKILIVLDQFEQWLHAHGGDEAPQLVDAFRQCDGRRVQCVVLVRDDFWLAVSRFMHKLEVPLVEGHNSALADLFDTQHAKKVLIAMGRAFQRLPEGAAELPVEQADFVNQAVAGLSEDGMVICVRLALFAEMMKGKSWTPKTLREVGGTEGVGVTFLEETFSAATAPPEHRFHQQAAQAVLRTLLPAAGTDIKGHMRSLPELVAASAYANRPRDLADLLRLLDSELRLITPTDPEGKDDADRTTPQAGDAKYYQLTHDYLVPALREWLTRKQRETRRGRASLLLAERAELWNSRRERNQLPTWWETLTIGCFTSRSEWTAAQRRMMKATLRLHLLRLAAALAVLLTASLAGLATWNQSVQIAQRHEASRFIDQVLVAKLDRLPDLLEQAPSQRALWREPLQAVANDPNSSSDERLRAHLALNRDGSTGVPYLVEEIQQVDLRESLQIRDELARWPAVAVPMLWKAISTGDCSPAARLRLASCLAQSDRSSHQWSAVAEDVAVALVAPSPLELGEWTRALQPVAVWLLPPLEKVYRAPQTSTTQRTVTAQILATFAAESPESLAVWLSEAGYEQFPALYAALARHRDRAPKLLRHLLAAQPADVTAAEAIARQTRAAAALLLLGLSEEVWPLLLQSAEPGLRTSLVSHLKSYGVPLELLASEVEGKQPASIRSALILAMGEYPHAPALAKSHEIVASVSRLYERDPDSGVHSASEWLLKKWGASLPTLARTALPQERRNRHWWVNSQGQTMVVQHGPVEFLMGSPVKELGRDPIETQRRETIQHTFAISAHEVTVEQFLRFDSNADYVRDVATSSCPINRVDWFAAVRYCRWLSEQEGIDESQMCYPPLKDIGPSLKLRDDVLSRTGYRLPTEAEWEFSCRAGASTPWHFGSDESYLTEHAWWVFNADERTAPVGALKPNALGLFDMHGNIQEWCHDLSSLPITDEVAAKLAMGADVRPGERMMRGGSYKAMTRSTRAAKLMSFPPDSLFSFVGFRIARTLP